MLGPDDNWCRQVNKARPGDAVLLSAGIYERPCRIRNSGTPGRPITLGSAADPGSQRAKLTYRGNSANVLELVGASNVVIRDLDFVRTRRFVDAIRIKRGSDILIENCRFSGIAGISVAAGNGDTARISIRGNTFEHLAATAIYIGCHQGDCRADDMRVEDNLIAGVNPPDQQIGYGLQLKLNAWGRVRNNRVFDTKGPGIMVYGSHNPAHESVVSGNLVQGSRTDGGIVVGGGPAWVYNNIAMENLFGGIVAQDYNDRDMQQDVRIVDNTVLDNYRSGIRVQHWRAGRGNVLADNAIVPFAGTPPLDPAEPEGEVVGNLVCREADKCFRDPWLDPYDLRPLKSGPLYRAAGEGAQAWRPELDFFGVRRPNRPSVGAIQGDSCGGRKCALGRGRPDR
jgi:hypothetical protein